MMNVNMKIKQFEKVLVEWQDACTKHELHTVEDAEGVELVDAETMGYLIKQTKEKTIISPFVFIDNEHEELFPKTVCVIPTKSIKNMYVLEKERKQ